MRAINPKRIVIFLVVSIPLTLVLGACTPSKKDEPVPAAPRFSSLSESDASCEAKIRRQMVEKSLKLGAVAGLEADIEAANALVANTTKTSYSATLSTEVESIELDHYFATPTEYQRVHYGITKADEYTAGIMRLEVTVESIEPGRDSKITQKFNVSKACELSITETGKIQYQKQSDQDYTYSEAKYFSNGETSTTSDSITTPAETGDLANLWPNRETIETIPESSYFHIPGLGLMNLISVKMPAKKMQEFGQEFDLDFQKVDFLKDGKVFVSVESGQNTDQGVSVSINQNSNTWKITKSIWEQLSLGTTRNTSSSVRSEFPKDYLTSHSSITLVTKSLPEYDHFAAYWTLIDKVQNGDSQEFNFSLSEVSNPEIHDTAKPEDLASNETIQTKLPQIQAIAKEILAKEPLSRKVQVGLILEYLGTNYKYDYDMLKNNTVRPLTTEEALNRKTGVCQHYSVIFTAIARALNIPTRIVVGYALSGDSPGAHAWVEVELYPNTWRVVEPQSPKGLEQTYTRFYFPMARATFLEDKKVGMLEYSKVFMDFRGVFKAVQP